jgi:hypothetical protein
VEDSASKFDKRSQIFKKVNNQTDVKYTHWQKMAEITLKGKEVTLAQCHQQILNLEAKNKEALQQRTEFQTWTYA